MKFEDKEKIRKLLIKSVRTKLIDALAEQENVVKLEGFTTEELDEFLFDYVDTHTSIKQKRFALPFDVLRKIDMSDVSFDDFDLKQIDFSKFTGVRIDPNKLYMKQCDDVNFFGVTFMDKFSDCYIASCDFKGSKNAVIDTARLGGYNSFCDVTFESPITNGSIGYSDFTGSKGAIVDVDKVDKQIDHCCLKDAKIRGSFNGCCITGTNFSGACAEDGSKIKINPNHIADDAMNGEGEYVKNITGCNFDGVEFTEEFGIYTAFLIRNTSFAGSEGAVLHPSFSIFNNDYTGATLRDVSFAPGSDIFNATLRKTDFTGSKGAVIDSSQKDMYMANLTDAAIIFSTPDRILSVPGVKTATCDGRLYCDVFKETYSKEFEEPVKVYSKKIDDAVHKSKTN